jgi:hypothetical protein
MALATLSSQEDTGNYQGVEVRASAVLTASLVYTTWMDARLHDYMDWVIYLTAQGSITRLDMQVQFSVEIVPNETTDWATLQAEDIDSSGVSTMSDYEMRKTISSVVTLGITSPARGRWMRLGIKAGVGAVAGSLCSIDALRRRPRKN